jgi:hypothetical protein
VADSKKAPLNEKEKGQHAVSIKPLISSGRYFYSIMPKRQAASWYSSGDSKSNQKGRKNKKS